MKSWHEIKQDDRFNGKPLLDFTKPEEMEAYKKHRQEREKEIKKVMKGYRVTQ